MADPTYQPTDRRPIAARRLVVFQKLAKALAHRGVSANAISIAGMISALVAGAALAATSCASTTWWLFLLAAAGVQLRLLANMIDGMVAIESGKASRVGEIYNEAPDRVSDIAVLVGAGYAAGGQIELGYLAAILAVMTAYIRAIGKAAGAANEFCGPMAKQQRMFIVTISAIYLALTPTSWQPTFAWRGASCGLLAIALIVIIVGCIATTIRRLARIMRALRMK